MKFHMYEGFGLRYPVVEIDGKIYGTIQSVAGELGVTVNTIHLLMSRRPDLFNKGLRLSDRQPNSELMLFFQQNKERLGIKRLRNDLRLLTRREMIRISRLVDSEKAWAYQERLDDLAEELWSLNSVPQAVFEQEHALRVKAEKEVADLRPRLAHMEKRMSAIEASIPDLDKAATAAGKALQAQKGTKVIRELN